MRPEVQLREAEAPLVAALDIGSSSVRALLFDRHGRAVANLVPRREHELGTTPDGGSEADAAELLRLGFECIDELLERAGERASEIAAVAPCSFVGNVLGLDRSGRPVTPLMSYADTRAAAEARALAAELDAGAIHQRTGCPLHPAYLPARLRWFEGCRAELAGEVRRWISLGEYLELELFGEAAVSTSVAAWSGLLDRSELCWDRELLDLLALGEDSLSPVNSEHEPRQGLGKDLAGRWPALAEAAWFPTVADGAAANIGSGCDSPQRVAVTIGTSSAVRAVVPYREVERIPEGLWCYRVDAARSLPGGALSEGGNLYGWIRQTFRLVDTSGLQKALALSRPDGHGLTVLPFLAGERSPGWAGEARGAVVGLSLNTTRLELMRAGIEAVAHRVALVHERLGELVPEDHEVVASGGALLGSKVWQQIVADALGRPVAMSSVAEASARGAALLALEALGVLDGAAGLPDFIGPSCEPDPGRHAVYREAGLRQQRLYEKLVGGTE